MAHEVGNQTLPLASFDAETSSGLPYLDVILEKSRLAIVTYCQDAWASLSKGVDAPIIKHAIPRSPKVGDLKLSDLPALYAFPTGISEPRRYTDEITLSTTTITMMWLIPPARDVIYQKRLAFWPWVAHALTMLMHPAGASVDTSSAGWGRMLVNEAGLWDLTLGKTQEAEVEIVGASEAAKIIQGYAWTWEATVASRFDFLTGPTAPICTQLRVNVGPDDDPLTVIEGHYPIP